MNQNLFKKVTEASYLTAQNVVQYRFILRFFYEEYKKINYFITPEEILAAMKAEGYFADYTAEQLQQDLNVLVGWQNLTAQQDSSRVASIEQFKQKRFRYRCARYTIEIERMLETLERITGHGGSLETTYFDKLTMNLLRIDENWDAKSDHLVTDWWRDLIDSFTKLTENATDYLAHLQNPKVENLMKSEAFLAFKDAVREYLREFMQALQQSMYQITGFLLAVDKVKITHLLERVCAYEMSIPRLDEKPDYDKLLAQLRGQWTSLNKWFLGEGERKSELEFVQQVTNLTIRRITRFAIRLSENIDGIRNRKQDYLTLARMFYNTDRIDDAHKLSACVFGVFHTRHIAGEGEKSTERIDLSIWDEPPFELTLTPRTRAYKMRTRSTVMLDHSAEKEQMLAEHLRIREEEQQMIRLYLPVDRFTISQLPAVNPYIRKTLLRWIDRAAHTKTWCGKTEDGREYQIVPPAGNQYVTLHCTDGDLTMPDYQFIFTLSKEGDYE